MFFSSFLILSEVGRFKQSLLTSPAIFPSSANHFFTFCMKNYIDFMNEAYLLLLYSYRKEKRILAFNTLFTLLHETEAGTACAHITMNFEHQDGSSLQIAIQKGVSNCMSLC